ncbi:MAG: hypothetical protein DHS20C18_21530 [Saprospiraceae bacterium]|nr:MAG: hypothetical protein DHS20C18_21530 [Saprospiraceae bacterium]
MKIPTIKIVVLLLAVCCSLNLSAQGRYSEAEVNREKLLIDASREKILGNLDKAIGILEELLKDDGTNATAAFELGRLYDAKGETESAIKWLKKATSNGPENPWFAQMLADMYQKSGQAENAANIYANLVKTYPKEDDYYLKWAYYLVKSNDLNKAIKVYDDLERQRGINEEVTRRKHSLYVGMGNNKKAAKELENLIDAYPEEIDYRILLANFYQTTGDQSAARQVYQDILAVDPGNVRATLALAGNEKSENDDQKYLQTLTPIFEQSDVALDLKISKLFPFIGKIAENGDVALADDVLALTNILEQVHPGEAKVLAAAGDLFYHSNRPLEALEKYEHVLELDESVFLVWENVMYIHLENNDYSSLLKTTEEVMDIFPNKAVAYYLNGVANDELGNSEDAVDALDQAVLMSAKDGRMQFNAQSRMGQVYCQLKKYDLAEAAFKAALELNPKSADVLAHYGLCLAKEGVQEEKALKLGKLAIDQAPGQPKFQAMYARILYKYKAYDDAKTWFDKALADGGSEQYQILEDYGDLLFQTGHTEEALRYWNLAKGKGSPSKVLDKKIANRQLYE